MTNYVKPFQIWVVYDDGMNDQIYAYDTLTEAHEKFKIVNVGSWYHDYHGRFEWRLVKFVTTEINLDE